MRQAFEVPTIAIIGGGFCGTILAANLVAKTAFPLKIVLIEKSSQLARGIPYSTFDPTHLLNVPTIKMGAFSQNSAHFFEWLTTHESTWRKKDPSFELIPLDKHSYFPRQIYGLYLESLLQETIKEAFKKNVSLSVHIQEAVDLEKYSDNSIKIELKNGETIIANAGILATGVPPSKSINLNIPNTKRYLHNVWSEENASFWKSNFLNTLSTETKIAIMGSGLTMVDTILSLLNRNFKGKIIVISKKGAFPEKHFDYVKQYPLFLKEKEYPQSALKLLQVIRHEIAEGNKKGYDWRSVIDSLRPITSSIWKHLPPKEKQKIMRFLFGIWNRHRHRTAPECLEKIEKYVAQEKIKLIAGNVKKIEQDEDQKLLISYAQKGFDSLKQLSIDYLINCTGAEMNLDKNNTSLIQNLLKKQYIIPDILNLGIQASPTGEVKGSASGLLFALGQILFGERFETTAVPELREQCAQLADYLLHIFTRIELRK